MAGWHFAKENPSKAVFHDVTLEINTPHHLVFKFGEMSRQRSPRPSSVLRMYTSFHFFQSALVKPGGTLSTPSRHGQREQHLRQPGGCHGASPWPARGSWAALTGLFSISSLPISSPLCIPVGVFHSIFRSVLIKCMLVAQSAQSCPILCDPMDCSPSGSSVHWIFQARVLEGCHFLLQGSS